LILQLRSSTYVQRQVRVLASDHLSDRQKLFAKTQCDNLSTGSYETARRPQVTRSVRVTDELYAVGRSNTGLANGVQLQQLRAFAHLPADAPVLSYARAFVRGEMLMGTAYRRSVKRNNAVFVYRVQGGHLRYGQARSFHLVGQGANTRLLVLARQFMVYDERFAEPGHTVTAELLQLVNSSIFRVHPIPYVHPRPVWRLRRPLTPPPSSFLFPSLLLLLGCRNDAPVVVVDCNVIDAMCLLYVNPDDRDKVYLAHRRSYQDDGE